MDKLENGQDIVKNIILRNLESKCRRYIKQTLERMEDQKLLNPENRKIIIDGFMDFYRAIIVK